MAITVSWDNPEQTIVRYEYSGQWTVGELTNAMREVQSLMDLVSHRVDVIIDMRESKFMPNSALSLGRNAIMRKHPNQGKSVIIGASNFARTLYNVFRQVYRTSFDESAYSFADNLEEARLYLRKETVTQS
jgi:hypothetical protein